MRGDVGGTTAGLRKAQKTILQGGTRVQSFKSELVNNINTSVVIFGYINLSDSC